MIASSSKLGALILTGRLEKVHNNRGELVGYLLDGKAEWSSYGDSFSAEGVMTIDPTGCWVTEVVGKVHTQFRNFSKIAAEGTIFPSQNRHCEVVRVKGKIKIDSYLGRSEAKGDILISKITDIQKVTPLDSGKLAEAYIRGHRCVAEQIDIHQECSFDSYKLVLTNKSGSAYLSTKGMKFWAPQIETFLYDDLERGFTYMDEILLWGTDPEKEERIEYRNKCNYPRASVTGKYVLGVNKKTCYDMIFVDSELNPGFFSRDLWVSA